MTTPGQTIARSLPGLLPQSGDAVASLGAKARTALSAFRCRLQGHAPALCVDGPRMYLACQDCRVESSGWELDLRAPRVRFDGAPDRFARYAWITGRR